MARKMVFNALELEDLDNLKVFKVESIHILTWLYSHVDES